MAIKIPETSPDIINWIASNIGAVLFSLSAGIFLALSYLGKNFWLARVIEPNELVKEEISEIKKELQEVRKDLAEQKLEQAKTYALLNSTQNLLNILIEKGKK